MLGCKQPWDGWPLGLPRGILGETPTGRAVKEQDGDLAKSRRRSISGRLMYETVKIFKKS